MFASTERQIGIPAGDRLLRLYCIKINNALLCMGMFGGN